MSSSIGRTDLKVNYEYDLIYKSDNNGQVRLDKTDYTDLHTMAQAIYLCLQTDKNEFVLKPNFGANPKRFVGEAISPSLLEALESYVLTNIQASNTNPDNLPLVVKAAPITRNQVAIRIQILEAKGLSNSKGLKITMLYDTGDNSIRPLLNGVN